MREFLPCNILHVRVHILAEFKEGAWGGANQFLKALRLSFIDRGVYAESPDEATHIIYNSYHHLGKALRLKRRFPHKVFVHRLGPVFYLHRGKAWKSVDRAIVRLATTLADGIIFQSHWALGEAVKLGFEPAAMPVAVIGNAVDQNVFNNSGKANSPHMPLRVVATSWSDNFKKGFRFLEYLDKKADQKYEVTFVGNSPKSFSSIKVIPPQKSDELAKILKEQDIFLAGMEDDACSNALLEALASGLPAVAYASGGNSELVKEGGELFQSAEEIEVKLDTVAQNYSVYQDKIKLESISEIAERYLGHLEHMTARADKSSAVIWYMNIKLRLALIRLRRFFHL